MTAALRRPVRGRCLALALGLAVVGGCAGSAGPVDASVADAGPEDAGTPDLSPPPLGVACAQYDELARECLAGCAPTWDCYARFTGLDEPTQIGLESCADCLLENLAEGVCADCADSAAGIASCQVFFEQLLAADCW